MEGVVKITMVALFATAVLCIPEGRLKRNYGDALGAGADGSTGYGLDSDEHAADIYDHPPCTPDNSDSPDHAYDFDDHPGHEPRRGFSVKAAAAASSSSFS